MGSVVLTGATSGSTTITPTDAVTATVTLPSTGGTLQTSGAGFTTNGVAYASSTSALTTGSALTFNGTNFGVGTTSPTTLVDLVRSSTSGSDVSMPNLFVRNTSATQGNGSSTFNQAVINVSAGNSTVFGGIRAAYDSAGSYGTGVQLYANSTNPLQFITNGSEAGRFDSSGNLLVGTTTANGRLSVFAPTGSAPCYFKVATNGDAGIFFANASNTIVGQVQVNSSSTAYVTSSDYRLKNTIAPMTGALAKVAQLKPVTYKWKVDGSDGQGFIAHELQAIVPECVTGEKDGVDEDGNPRYQGIDTSFLVATLTSAIQELSTLITAQQSTIQSLTERITALEGART